MALPSEVDVYQTTWPYTGGRAILAHLPLEQLDFTIPWSERADLIPRVLRVIRERTAQAGANAAGINGPLDVEVEGDLIRCKVSVLCYLLETRSPEAEQAAEDKAAEAQRKHEEAKAAAAARAMVSPPDAVAGVEIPTEAYGYGPGFWYGG